MQGVNGWHPHQAAPLNFEPGTIHDDINRTHVSHFPKKEFAEVYVLGQCRKEESPIHGISVQLVGAVAKAQTGQLPKRHGESAIDEPFQIQTKYTRVELRPPDIILKEASQTSLILCGGKVYAFQSQKDAEDHTKDIQQGDRSGKCVVDDAKIV